MNLSLQTKKSSYFLKNKLIVILGFVGVITLFFLDKLVLGKLFRYEGVPKFSWEYIANSIFISVSVFLILWNLNKKNVSSNFNNSSLEKFSLWIPILISTIFLAVFFVSPTIFHKLSKEDGIVEWLSAIFLFISSGVLVVTFLKVKSILKEKGLKILLGLFAFGFFVLAMEEVSWFQRVFEIETPKGFEENVQGEMNLHNFATNGLELIYYVGSFFCLVVGSFLRVLYPKLLKSPYLNIFLPMPVVAIAGAIACAYNYDMWNMIFIQFTFYGSLGVLFLYTLFFSKNPNKGLIVFAILLMLVSQISFIVFGENFDRLYEITEFKEFQIAGAWLIYTICLRKNLLREKSL